MKPQCGGHVDPAAAKEHGRLRSSVAENGSKMEVARAMTLRVDRRSQVESLSPTQCRRALDEAEERYARLETDRVRLEAILQGSRDAIWSWNTDGIVVWWNAAAEKLLGYAADEIVGQSLLKLVRPERHDASLSIIAAVRKGAWYERHETLRVRKDGRLIDVELTVSPVSTRKAASSADRPSAARSPSGSSLRPLSPSAWAS